MIAQDSRCVGVLLFVLFFSCFAQSPASFEPTFCVSLSGKTGSAADSMRYSYQLNQTADSGVIIAQGRERPLGKSNFAKIKKSIITYAVNLTEENYGTPRDSADFSGDLTITALDRTTIIKFSARLVIGTLGNTPMTGLLRLLMKQVEDTVRLPQFKEALFLKKSALPMQ
ncbi:MAG: hypothetical protein ABSF80_05905 [Chitinispirillaceae bacterium]|jgi:hypothetical protein